MKIAGFICAILLLASCTSNTAKMNELSWLEGTWTRQYNGVTQMEEWISSNSQLLGKSVFITNQDSTVTTTFKISPTKDGIVYVSQETNFEDSTIYEMEYFSADSIVFTTNQPIWPKSVLLYNKEPNTLIKSLTGVQQQMKNFVHFEFQKVKPEKK